MRNVLTIYVVIFVLYVFNDATGRNIQCKGYENGKERPPVMDGMGRSCPYIVGFTLFCLDYPCPSLDCNNTLVDKLTGQCDRCNGDCEWLGSIVKNGSTGTCEDGCNECRCMNGAASFIKKITCPPLYICTDAWIRTRMFHE